jgi:hypothetical protein
VRQTPDGVDVGVVADGEVDAGALAAALEASLRDAGLPGATAAVRRVEAIPRHPQTGKARRFVPLVDGG